MKRMIALVMAVGMMAMATGCGSKDEGAAGGNAAPKKGAVEKQRFP